MAVPLLQRRFLIISGKGGVGRTTVALVLARVAGRLGRRVLLAQMDAPERLGRLLGLPRPVGASVTSVDDRLDVVNMTPRESLHQYGVMTLRYEALYRAVFDNRAARAFLAAVPGLDAFAMLGKAWWHTTEQVRGRDKYDLVILDAPASGHAVKALRIPQAILSAMPRGPLARDAGAMRSLLVDPARCAFVPVTLAEELPAQETAELVRQARGDLAMPLGPLVVNALLPESLGHPALGALFANTARGTGDPELDRALAAAALLSGRRRLADTVLDRLARDPGLPIIVLPRLASAELGPPEIDVLADHLAASLQHLA